VGERGQTLADSVTQNKTWTVRKCVEGGWDNTHDRQQAARKAGPLCGCSSFHNLVKSARVRPARSQHRSQDHVLPRPRGQSSDPINVALYGKRGRGRRFPTRNMYSGASIADEGKLLRQSKAKWTEVALTKQARAPLRANETEGPS
jgi:hypothetical protein